MLARSLCTHVILKKYIDKIVVVYLNDIFIFNKILKKYKKYSYIFYFDNIKTNQFIYQYI